jgi:hypothetical protein
MVGGMVGDEELAAELLSHPPFAIFYGALAFMLCPWLVILMSSPRIAEEVSSKSVRYVLFRTGRGTWCMGKLAGQAVMLAVALAAGAGAAWCIGHFRMAYFEGFATAQSMLVFACRVWVFSFAYLGIALGVSQVTRVPVLAITFGLITMLALTFVAAVSEHYAAEGWRHVLDVVHALTPQANRTALWRSSPAHTIPAAVTLIAVGFTFFLAGHARFARANQ